MENSMEVPLKTKSRATIWSHNPTAGQISRGKHDPKGYMHPNVHCSLSTIHGSMSRYRSNLNVINRGMNKGIHWIKWFIYPLWLKSLWGYLQIFYCLFLRFICYILGIRPLSDMHLKIFYSNLGLCFVLITLCFTEQKFNFNEIQLFSFIDHAFGIVI